MCGILGMVSTEDVVHATIARLGTMEYRGYDSYGLGVVAEDSIFVVKDIGSIGKAIQAGRFTAIPSARITLGHTRWATHGVVSRDNAHPLLSYDASIAIVHNGVIVNYVQLRRELEGKGIRFESQTDSEVVAHLIAWYVEAGNTLLDAICMSVVRLVGEYALGIISTADPNSVYGARCKSPLLLSSDGRRAILASDQIALGGASAGGAMFLEDGDIVRLCPEGAEVFTIDADGHPESVKREFLPLTRHEEVADRGNFSHFMLKEINETPAAVISAMQIPVGGFIEIAQKISDRTTTLFGAGSGSYLAQIGQYLLAKMADVTVLAFASDEAQNLTRLGPSDLAIAISQSGETFDTLEMCRLAVNSGATLISISNVPNSTQERLATYCLRQSAGLEISVLSTKSIISQVIILARLALEAGRIREIISHRQCETYRLSLVRLPESLRVLVADVSEAMKGLARKYAHMQHWFFLGRGILFPVAMESALKFKEASYLHAEGLGAGSFKHGPLSLIAPEFCTVALLPSPVESEKLYTAMLANVSEISARGGAVIGIGPENIADTDIGNFADYISLAYHGDSISDVCLQLVAGQLLAYYCALELGREIDQPRYLAKSVTVR